MASMPRIITVDPTWTIPRIVRAAMDLLDRPFIQVDVPAGNDALDELSRGCNLVVAAYDLEDNLKGWELAMRIRKSSAETAVIILGEAGDPDEFDEETIRESPYVYLVRPVDLPKFLRVLVAGLESHDAMIMALAPPPAEKAATAVQDMGPVPVFDVGSAQMIVDSLLKDLGAMAIILASREGQVLLERGAAGYIDREALTQALLPLIMTNIGVKDIVGGQVSTVQFYDGDNYDVFVLSVGLHHFMCVMYDGQMGSRQFGNVTRYGRRATEDLIALLGANAFIIQAPTTRKEEPAPADKKKKLKKATEEAEVIVLERANLASEPEPQAFVVSTMPQLEPIADLDMDKLFGSGTGGGNLDDMFDPDKLEELAKSNFQQGNVLDWDDAQKLGLLKG